MIYGPLMVSDSAMNLNSEQGGEVMENEAPDYALPAQRRSELLRVAKKRGAISVAEIALQFAVSADTIRRDLDYLSERGLIRRTHGGGGPFCCVWGWGRALVP